jgi:arginase
MISVLGIPWDANSSFLQGPSLAPVKIREAFHSDSGNYFTESGIDLKGHGGWQDAGDISFNDNVHFAKAIESRVADLVSGGRKIFALGGDHSVTYPIVRGVHQQYSDLTILHLDAHADLYDNFENNPYSHASPFARILENKLAKRLVQAGIRTMNAHQRKQADRFGVEVLEMKNWNDSIRFDLAGPVYLSLDMDAIDPAFAPGVSHYEPGGFSTRQVLSILQNLKCNLVGADLVEFNPNRDPSGVTAMLAGKLYKEILDALLR